MLQPSKVICGGVMGLLCGLVAAADIRGYLVDGSGQPVRSASGDCIRTGSWSAQTLNAACDVMPDRSTPDRIVLLPGPDAKPGAVIVRSGAGETRLDSAYAGAEVAKSGAILERRESAASVAQRYGALLAAQPPRPVSFTVHFATGSATNLTPESRPVIDAIKAELAARPAPEIAVIGHTDRVGDADANDKLSVKRAETVKDILIAAGAQPVSLEATGRGEREPVVPTADGVAEPRNRRVEISVR